MSGDLNLGNTNDMSSSLNTLQVSQNSLRSVSRGSLNFPNLEHINFESNSIETLEAGVLDNLVYLKTANFALNNISEIDSSMFLYNVHLHTIFLFSNNLETIRERTFALPSLQSLVLNQNNLRSIEAYAFASVQISSLDLSNQLLNSIEDFAFKNLSATQINLAGNGIQKITPQAFEGWSWTSDRRYLDTSSTWDTCTDIPMYSLNNPFNGSSVETCDSIAAMPISARYLLLSVPGVASLSPLDACCEFGGGNEFGTTLLMDSESPVRCYVASGNVLCTCGDDSHIYDFNTQTCKERCESDSEFVSKPVPENAFNTHMNYGECVRCPWSQESDGFQCRVCDNIFYIGSNAGCDFPVLGILFGLLLLAIGFCCVKIILMMKRRVSKLNTRIRITKDLLHAKENDIALLAAAWSIDWTEVEIHKDIANGAYGSVHEGTLREQYVVRARSASLDHFSFSCFSYVTQIT